MFNQGAVKHFQMFYDRSSVHPAIISQAACGMTEQRMCAGASKSGDAYGFASYSEIRCPKAFFRFQCSLMFFSSQVGSTGVGALTVAFIIFAVSTVVFLAKANSSGEQRK